MIMFCKDLKKQTMKIIYYKKKKIIPLTDKEKEIHENKKVCYICEKEFSKYKKVDIIKFFKKLEIIAIIQDNIEELLIVFVI